MRPIQPQRRRTSGSFWLGLLFIVILLAGGVVGVLLLVGVPLNPFAGPGEDPYMVRIPINSQPIPAYERVERSHMLNQTTGGLMYQSVPPAATVGMAIVGVGTNGSHVEGAVADVKNIDDRVVFVVEDGREVKQSQTIELGGALMNVNAIIGRVVKRDKRVGMGFREETFFPEGTPAGIAGATPPGMRSMTLDATSLTGVHALNVGDRIDLMCSVPVGELAAFDTQYSNAGRQSGASLIASIVSDSAGDASAVEPMLLAENALVLKPVYVRNEAVESASLTQGKRVQNVPRYEVAIAVEPGDVVPLQSALSKKLRITCIAHSMQSVSGEINPAANGEEGEDELLAPVTVRRVYAYDVITREAFISPATRKLRLQTINRKEADQLGIVVSVESAIGAVARRDIPAGSFLRRTDLLTAAPAPEAPPSNDNVTEYDTATSPSSELRWIAHGGASTELQTSAAAQQPPVSTTPGVIGDRPAITRFVPPGYRAMALPWNRLYGSEHLQIEDRIDVLAGYQLERGRQVQETERGSDDSDTTREYDEIVSRGTNRTWEESLGDRGEPWFVATDAIVVGPIGYPPPNSAVRALATASAGANAPGSTANLSGPSILVAVNERDVDAVSAALNTRDVLFSVAFRAREVAATPVGYKRIAIAPDELPAFSLFSDLVWKGRRREIVARLVRTDDKNFRDAIAVDQIQNYFGRTLSRSKLRFAFFTPEDFMPDGVEPGIAAGVGSNMVAVVATTDQISGVARFRDNDRIALLQTGNLEQLNNTVFYGVRRIRAAAEVVVQDCRVVRSASELSNVVTLEVPKADVAQLQAALFANDANGENAKHNYRLVAVARARGGTPLPSSAPVLADISDYLPLNNAPKIEALIGERRRLYVFDERPAPLK